MTRQTNRRDFLKNTALTGVGVWAGASALAQEDKSANDQIQFGCIGIEGKGSSDTEDASRAGRVVAVCDVDEGRLEKAAAKYKAKKYTDFRKMLEENKDLDAVTVSTPDHTHAPASLMAMKMGLHCFCQKPLTQSVYEARLMAETATKMKVATQMGNQGTSGGGLRKAAALLKAGAIGTIKEVHVWTNRPIWAQGGPRPKPTPPPANLNWDLWIGAAPFREHSSGYHPFSWRGWWDFGTGALGDMACHTFNMPYMGLDLKNPTSITAESSGHNRDSYPKWSVIEFAFPATDNRPAIPVTWYDGGKKPNRDLLDGQNPADSGALIVGEKGKLYSPGDYGDSFKILSKERLEEPKVEFVSSPGHFVEFARAIRDSKTPAMSNFSTYSGGLTETILLGNLAVWAADKAGEKKTIEWDAKELKAKNNPDVAGIIKREYRKGYSY